MDTHAGTGGTVDEAAIREFIDAHVARVAPLALRLNEEYWQLNITGKDEHAREAAKLSAEHTKVYANADEFAMLRDWREAVIDDTELARQVELLYLAYLGNQKDDETIERISALEMELETEYSNHRGLLDGKPTSDNDLKEVLANETDSAGRRAAWEASKSIGPKVAPRVLELVRLRNATARKMGFATYYQMSLAQQELEEAELFALLADLADRTLEPFRAMKQGLDAGISRKLGVPADELMPWHYGDFFFQEIPSSDEVDLDPFFSGSDPVELARATFGAIGIEIEPILKRSDLYPKEGKNQHAFCIHMDREDDVRMLTNLKDDEYWTNTLLHELGHGIYDYYLDRSLPYVIREAAHTMTTEAVAMLFGRLTKTGYWLKRFAGAEGEKLERTLEHLKAHQSAEMLIFTRWCLVMTHFEREMYAAPEQDLNGLWWDTVERFQMLRRPEGRNEPDWAAKLHLALAPVYYHNYMLGEMTASQIEHRIVESVCPDGQSGSPAVGEFLRTKLFAGGARQRWDETLASLTGEPLSAEYFAAQFVAG